MLSRHFAQDARETAGMPAATEQAFHIVLVPLSHPELGDIRIDEALFAIGRNEAPFESYAPDIIADLSRRHARIFCEYGAVYIADLDSKNGTTVNGADIRQKTSRLQQGDVVCFGGALSYRVELGKRADIPETVARTARLVSLTLTPERDDLGLQPIVVTHFPFLISKADAAFSRYKEDYPHQVNYLSRRHAHLFLKGGAPFVEDLGSTNGTFVGGKRLDEHAVALNEGESLAFGGHHFVYKVSLQRENLSTDPTQTKLSPGLRVPRPETADADKTTFVAAADSFLDIFCVDPAPQQEDEVNDEAAKAEGANRDAGGRRPRSRAAIFLSELRTAFAGTDRGQKGGKRWVAGAGAAVVVLAGAAAVLYLAGSPERDVAELVGAGEYSAAATEANRQLKSDPDNGRLQALNTEALLKAGVPAWLDKLKARDYDGARAALGSMKALGSNNADALPLLDELAWIGDLEQFVVGRGGVEAPIRMYGDEERIRSLLKRWNEDSGSHQRAFAKISAYVPEFRDPYADALSHLRKLQSDEAVYLAAIDRLKASIATELREERPNALEPLLRDYAEKYPRIAGLDALREDLRRYIELDSELQAQRLGALVPLLAKTRFTTPPFEARFRELRASGRLPSDELVSQYEAVSGAWRKGDTANALAGLRAMTSGPWSEAASQQLDRKKALADQFAALQKGRGGKGYDDRLINFYVALDPDEDVYFLRAVAADVDAYRDKAIKRAQGLLDRAQTQWTQYRDNGAIDGTQRLDPAVTETFRSQARLLSKARDDAQRGMRVYTQLKAKAPPQQEKLVEEIDAESGLQRRLLMELRKVLEPNQLKAKLALLGSTSDEQGKSTETTQ